MGQCPKHIHKVSASVSFGNVPNSDPPYLKPLKPSMPTPAIRFGSTTPCVFAWVPASYCGSRVPGISVALTLGVWGERPHWHWECGVGTYTETHWLSSSTGVEGYGAILVLGVSS
jgi:hypothetical protein